MMPAWIEPQIVSYPRDLKLSYDQLRERVESALPRSVPIAILAESFSSPLAVIIAAKKPEHLRAVILCAGFVRSPVGSIAGCLARVIAPIVFAIRAPKAMLRRYLVGSSASDELVRRVGAVIAQVSRRVLAHRLGSVVRCDCRGDLRKIAVPMLYVGAAQDRLIGKRSAEVIWAARPEAEFAMIDGPHLIVQTRVRAVADEVVGFLQRVC